MVPCPGRLATEIAPPIARVSRCAIIRPRPLPPNSRAVSGVGLGEGEPNRRCSAAGRDAGTGILDLDRQPNDGRAAIGPGATRSRHVAGRGELERIADQVEQHLAQPAGIDPDLPRGAGQQLAAELDLSRAGARLHLQAQPVEERGQIDVDRCQLELAGIDPAQVEHVVDDRQQRLGGFDRAVDVDALLRIERRIAQQPGHAHDTVHRLADLVAHHGEKTGTGAARRLGAPTPDAQPRHVAPQPTDGAPRRISILRHALAPDRQEGRTDEIGPGTS